MYWNKATGDAIKKAEERLIETWDVLKFCTPDVPTKATARLIETWDVLKFYK